MGLYKGTSTTVYAIAIAETCCRVVGGRSTHGPVQGRRDDTLTIYTGHVDSSIAVVLQPTGRSGIPVGYTAGFAAFILALGVVLFNKIQRTFMDTV